MYSLRLLERNSFAARVVRQTDQSIIYALLIDRTTISRRSHNHPRMKLRATDAVPTGR
jgi:hypothetical protein